MRHLVSLYIILAATLAATLPVPLAEISTEAATKSEFETGQRTEEEQTQRTNLTEKDGALEESFNSLRSNMSTDIMARAACQRAEMMIRDKMVPDDADVTDTPAIVSTKKHKKKKKSIWSMLVIIIIVIVLCCILIICLPLLCLCCGCCGLALSPCLACLSCGEGCCGGGDDDD